MKKGKLVFCVCIEQPHFNKQISHQAFVGMETGKWTFGPFPCLANQALQSFQDAAIDTVLYSA